MILSRAHVLLKDDRKDLRIRESGRIPWQIKYKQREGLARIRNMSISGMLIETDTSFNPKDECIFSFDSDIDAGIYIPQVGRLVWLKKKRFTRKKYLCGIKFLEADEQVLTQMRTRVQQGVDQFVKKRRITTVAGMSVCVLITAILGYLAWFSSSIHQDVTTANQRMLGTSGQQVALSHSYANLYRANAIKLAEATEKLNIANQLIAEDQAAVALYAKELEATRALLSQTETMLIEANDRNAQMTQEMQRIKSQGPVLASEDSIITLEDATSLLSAYKLKIRSIKSEIKRIKNEERTAFNEQKILLGNNGFFMKDGQRIQVDEAQYMNLTVDQLKESIATQPSRNVEIDVTFIE